MSLIKVDFVCPKCHKKYRIKLFKEVNQDKIPEIIDRSLFKAKCSECGEEVTLDYSLVLYGEDYLIYYKVNDEKVDIKEERKIKRICTSFKDFKEKILIFRDNLNDVLIEFIKETLLRSIKEDFKDEITDIRYNSLDKNKIVFYAFGTNKYLFVNKEDYDKYLSNFKNIEISDLIEVNKDTYFKYYEMMKK